MGLLFALRNTPCMCVLNEKRPNKLQMHRALIVASYLSGCHPWGLRSVCEQSALMDL